MKKCLLTNSLVAIVVMACFWYANRTQEKSKTDWSASAFWVFYGTEATGSQYGLFWDGSRWRCEGLKSITAIRDDGSPIELVCDAPTGNLTVTPGANTANQRSTDPTAVLHGAL